MEETSRVKAALVSPEDGVDLIAHKVGGRARLEPVTQRAEQWLHRVG